MRNPPDGSNLSFKRSSNPHLRIVSVYLLILAAVILVGYPLLVLDSIQSCVAQNNYCGYGDAHAATESKTQMYLVGFIPALALAVVSVLGSIFLMKGRERGTIFAFTSLIIWTGPVLFAVAWQAHYRIIGNHANSLFDLFVRTENSTPADIALQVFLMVVLITNLTMHALLQVGTKRQTGYGIFR